MAGRRATEAARELGLPPTSLQRLAAAVTEAARLAYDFPRISVTIASDVLACAQARAASIW